MTDEDRTAERLKGFNILIKFKDGEELLIDEPDVGHNPDDESQWFRDVEDFINGSDGSEFFPTAGLAISRDSIKYVKKI